MKMCRIPDRLPLCHVTACTCLLLYRRADASLFFAFTSTPCFWRPSVFPFWAYSTRVFFPPHSGGLPLFVQGQAAAPGSFDDWATVDRFLPFNTWVVGYPGALDSSSSLVSSARMMQTFPLYRFEALPFHFSPCPSMF